MKIVSLGYISNKEASLISTLLKKNNLESTSKPQALLYYLGTARI